MGSKNEVAWGLLVVWAVLAFPRWASAQSIDVTPMAWDYGDVEVGDSGTQTFTLSSLGPSELTVYSVEVEDDITGSFSITAGPAPPLIIPVGNSVDFDVTFAPVGLGAHSASLYVDSNAPHPTDPENPPLLIPLQGVGVTSTVAHWRFEEGPHGAPLVTAVDSGPNGLDGVPGGSLSYTSYVAPTDDSGDFALDAAGDYNYVIVSDAPELRLSDDFTIEAYVLPDNTNTNPSGNPHYVFTKRHTPANGTYLVSYGLIYDQASGFFGAIVGFGSDTGEIVTSSADYLDERWYHVAITFDNDSVSGNATLKVYVDGDPVGTNTFTNPGLYYTAEPFVIGAANFGGPTHQWRRNFDGLIDEVRISDRVLSPEEFLAPPPLSEVPTLSPWGLVVAVLLLAGVGAYLPLRRRAEAR